LPLPKAPNQELLEHEKKRQIESKIYSFVKKLRKDEPTLTEDEINNRTEVERTRLKGAL
jgi:hypothetical protein